MHQQHQYALTVQWTGNTGSGTSHYRSYSRNHTIIVPDKVDIPASSDPAFLGDQTKHNPEELFLASIAACHMLWYLHLCAEAGVVVLAYTDQATGTMAVTPAGGGHFTGVTLSPTVQVQHPAMLGKANALHEEANKRCFIANSCNFPIHHKPTCLTEDAPNED